MSILAVIVTYNGERWIKSCIHSLLKGSVVPKILVVDNCSTDRTVDIITEDFKNVELFQSAVNLGFGKANNIGLCKAAKEKYDYVFLINQDTEVEYNCLELLQNTAKQNINFGIISPLHLLPGKERLEWHFSVFISADKCPDLVSDMYFNKTKDIYKLPFVNAAAWLISRVCLMEVGGFDPLFPHYGEDEDYCNRALFKNFEVGVAPASRIIHDISMKSWDEIKNNFQRQLIFAFIELKNMNLSYRYLRFNFVKTRLERLLSLLITGRWKELSFMSKVFLRSLRYFGRIGKARKISQSSFSFLKDQQCP